MEVNILGVQGAGFLGEIVCVVSDDVIGQDDDRTWVER